MSAAEPMIDPPAHVPECCDRDGAFRIKLKIEAYWRERGYDVSVRIEKKGYVGTMRGARFDVRSDLFNGQPMPNSVARSEAA